MADFEYAVDGNIGLMRFNRPERMNAITYDMLALIEEAVGEADRDDRVRAVVVTGEGRAFSAGTDLQQMATSPPARGRAEMLGEQYNDAAPAPWTFPMIRKPVVAAVNGAAIGLGAEFTLQCDVRIASESARFGWVFVHRGIVPDAAAGTWLLPRIVGSRRHALVQTRSSALKRRRQSVTCSRSCLPSLMDRALSLAAQVAKGAPAAWRSRNGCCTAGSRGRRWNTFPTAPRP